MPPTNTNFVRRYGVAVVAVIVAVAVRLVLDQFLENWFPLATTVMAVAFVAASVGTAPAWVTLVLGALAVDFLIMEPRFSLRIAEEQDVLRLLLYAAGGGVLIGLFEQLRTERQRAESNIVQSEERFRQLADAMPQIVWTALPAGEIDYLNRQWFEYTGLPQSIGNKGWAKILHPADAPLTRPRWAESLRSGTPFQLEVRLLQHKTQDYRWHLMRTVAIRDSEGNITHWFGTATDIDEQKRAEEASRYLAEASAALAAVVDYESTLQKVANLAVPYFADWCAVDMLNDDGTLRRLVVAHHDPAKIDYVHQLQREYPSDPQAPMGAYAVLRSGKPQMLSDISDELIVRSAKDARHVELIRALGLKSFLCVPLVVSGKVVGVFIFATADSGRRYNDADMALAMNLASRAAVALENGELLQALRESDRRKDEFLATLAHELRNPLAPISNALEILKMPQADALTRERSRDMMERQVNLLVRLVDDLLDVSRVMAGKIELRLECVALASIVARAVEMVQTLVDGHAHVLDVQLPDETLAVDADP
ncbi:MAG: DUF4118 domain-containing protein, partial [Pseudomonadota bacterium]